MAASFHITMSMIDNAWDESSVNMSNDNDSSICLYPAMEHWKQSWMKQWTMYSTCAKHDFLDCNDRIISLTEFMQELHFNITRDLMMIAVEGTLRFKHILYFEMYSGFCIEDNTAVIFHLKI